MATATVPTDVSPNKPTHEPDEPVGVTQQTSSDTSHLSLPTTDTEMAAMGNEGAKPTSAPESPSCSTADTDMSSELGCMPLGGVITESMLNIEKELHRKSKEEEKRFQQESLSAWEKEQDEQRYKRLQHLLEKSSIYSNFLLKKMEEQQKEEILRQERLAKKLKKKEEEEKKKEVSGEKENRETKDGCESPVAGPVTRRSGRSRKLELASPEGPGTSDSQKQHRHSHSVSQESPKDELVKDLGSLGKTAGSSHVTSDGHTRDDSENLGLESSNNEGHFPCWGKRLRKRHDDRSLTVSGEQEITSKLSQESSDSESWKETSDSDIGSPRSLRAKTRSAEKKQRNSITVMDVDLKKVESESKRKTNAGFKGEMRNYDGDVDDQNSPGQKGSFRDGKSPRAQLNMAEDVGEEITVQEISDVIQESSQGSQISQSSLKIKRKSPQRCLKMSENVGQGIIGVEISVDQESETSPSSLKIKRNTSPGHLKMAKDLSQDISDVSKDSQGSQNSQSSLKIKRKSPRRRLKTAESVRQKITSQDVLHVCLESQGSENSRPRKDDIQRDEDVSKEVSSAEIQDILEVEHTTSDKSSNEKQGEGEIDEGNSSKDWHLDLTRLPCSVEEDSQEPCSSQVEDRGKTPVSSARAGSQELKTKTANNTPKVSHGKVRKRAREDYTIADYIDKSALSPMKRKRGNDDDKQISRLADVGSPNTQESPVCTTQDVVSSDEEAKTQEECAATAQGKHDEDFVDTYSRKINGESISDLQPDLFTGGVLRKYQVEGIEWLKVLYENGVNGILGDEMGLGKTIQCIGLFAHIIKMGVPGPFLVVAPLSTLSNWISEFQRFAPSIKVILYHGTPPEREHLRHRIHKQYGVYKTHPVVVTSYEIVMIDRKYLSNHLWKYIIVDEGHRIKNLNCRLIRELKMYHSANRVLLTGTPLQNNLSELWSMLNFLLPEVFDDLKTFESWFDFSTLIKQGGDEAIVAKEREQHVVSMLHQILSPFLLRRLKSDVELKVPPKKEILVQAPLTAKQAELYKDLVDKTIMAKMKTKHSQPVDETVELTESGRVKRKCRAKVNYAMMGDIKNTAEIEKEEEEEDVEDWMQKVSENEECCKKSAQKGSSTKLENVVLNIKTVHVMTQLRKACNHPYLLEYPLDPETQEYRIDEELVSSSGKLMVLERLLPSLKKQDHKVLIFSQMTKMLDVLEDYCYLRKYSYCRLDGSMKMSDRQEQIDDFNKNPDIFLFLLSTRAGGLGINLTAADTVIIYDSDWNPQSDLQAQDRCHRIGQTKPVVIYRLTTSNTIDQKIVERAAAKRRLEKMVIHQGKFKGGKSNLAKDSQSLINPTELLELLRSSDHSGVVKNCNEKVISDADLALLLDRSDLIATFEGKKAASDSKNATRRRGKSNVQSNVFKILDDERGNEGSELRIST